MSLIERKGSLMRRLGVFEVEVSWGDKGEIEIVFSDPPEQKMDREGRITVKLTHSQAAAVAKALHHALTGGL